MVDHEGHDHHPHGAEADGTRVTSPMQAFDTAQVGVGLAVLAVGLAVTFGVPILLA